MADKKISQLTAASTPLAGTEVLPIVQSSTTVKVSAADVTAGRAVSALTYTSTVATGTAPFTVSSTTQVANLNAATAGTASNLKSNATTGVMQIAGPAAAATRVMTIPDANFTVARADAANSLTGDQTITSGSVVLGTAAKGIDFSANTHAAGMTSELLNWYEEGTWTPSQGSGLAVTGDFSSTGTYTRIGRQVTVIGSLKATTSLSCAAGAIITSNLPFAVQGEIPNGGIQNATGTVLSGISGNPTTALVYAMESQGATTALYFQMTYFV